MSLYYWLLVLLAALIPILLNQNCVAHPQCLDYGAPFKAKRTTDKQPFCRKYAKFGCCTAKRDSKIKELFQTLPDRSNPKCSRLLESVLCLECHSYAAHIFLAEGNDRFDASKLTPGLCRGFCRSLFKECGRAVKQLVRQGIWSLRSNLESGNSTVLPDKLTASSVCSRLELNDTDYCYPNVDNIDKINLARRYNYQRNKNCLCVKEVVSGLRNPLAAVHSGDGTNRLFIAEQVGVVRILDISSGRLLGRPFLNFSRLVLTTGSRGEERGLLGIAFHPNYAKNGRFFVYYSSKVRRAPKTKPTSWGSQHKTVLSQFMIFGSDPNVADPGSERVILEVVQPADNHNGGNILFGEDGFLYLTLGDGGLAGDPFGQIGNGLNRSTLLGSVIRIDVNTKGNTPYKIPRDNPFRGTAHVRPEIYAYGVRNMWRCSVDRGDRKTGQGKGRIFCGDVGQDKFEEIDIIYKGGNYGWKGREGYSCYQKTLCNSKLLDGAIPPIHVYNHSVGRSIVGGYVYRGCKNPNLSGKYIFGDTMNGRMFALTENTTTNRWENREVCFGDRKYCTGRLTGDYPPHILSFGEDETGEVYFLSTDSMRPTRDDGKVYRLVDPARRGNPEECKRKLGCRDKSSATFCSYYKRIDWCTKYPKTFMNICLRTCFGCRTS